MNRSSTLFRFIGRLGLLAGLLMALAPSASRVLSGTGPQVLPGWTELCTSTGMHWVDTGAPSPSQTPFSEGPHAAMGEDCSYCRLVDLLLPVILFLGLVLPRAAAARLTGQPDPPLRLWQNLRGLGSRGPPVLL
ncbi:hypothetical protein ARC78_10850 [Stenotrophomonas pictorum JCM 9942]|uniref:DUF2946 domain-containing protein n=1 Tax=Stenotrophomonas pictorum JCM 9942 TaxID=1236960 RepID=A0A0R0AI94_9GAMM|nr:DUF2946 family protein [Stenotrophomonas pictorum]KRG41562.1 hypothetical protein ARC78_10850 [Stenotrophomonas pictorum JCM 9942]